jgi:DNA mismatch repair protein MutS
MQQYLDIKSDNPDSILFFRMGDFYEMFFDDAETASSILGIALTSRDRERKIPMCGVPHHSAGSYIARLVRQGLKVAICEQVTEPQSGRIVERAVTRIITPGVALDDEMLDPKANNHIMAIAIGKAASGIAYMDASTGEFRLTEVSSDKVMGEVKRVGPLEVLVPEGEDSSFNSEFRGRVKVTALPLRDFDYRACVELLKKKFGEYSLPGLGLGQFTAGVSAAGAVLKYVSFTQRSQLGHVKSCAPYFLTDHLIVDSSTARNLELVSNMKSGDRRGTLIGAIDRTLTPMGGRMLRDWLLHPLKDIQEINRRLDGVTELLHKQDLRKRLRTGLSKVYDIERLASRVCVGAAGPKDLVCLKDSIDEATLVTGFLKGSDSRILNGLSGMEAGALKAVDMIRSAISDSAPASSRDSGVIKAGYSNELDELRDISANAKDSLARLEAEERKRTGINTLKVGFNRVFGYYIEVTRPNLPNVPADYARKQTLVNGERFVTKALKEFEEKISVAEERASSIETLLFREIIEKIAGMAGPILDAAKRIAVIDCIASLSETAHAMNYSRPVVDNEDRIIIKDGRHPVVEAESRESFVPNDLLMDSKENQIIILTGPNMAGKSTYLRQNALIALLAHTGSFVPASSATVGVLDRIFTRIGASDDLASGQSTFMVEMTETANILNNATGRSLVILDEIGRGTSTFDGLSIAWSVVEYLHDWKAGGAKTLFATHYHELTELALTKQRVKNYNMTVADESGRVVFLKKVQEGGSPRSYGIHVAELAGLPSKVVERAREILGNLETGELDEKGLPRISVQKDKGAAEARDDAPQRVIEGLKRIDVNNITPMEAIVKLSELRRMTGD